jgi:type IV pilus assembly protein PilF
VTRKIITFVFTALLIVGCVSTDPQKAKPEPGRASDLNLEMGIDYLRKGNLSQAKEKIDRAIEQNPRNAKAHAAAGVLYDRLGQTDKADSHFSHAVSLDGQDPDIRNNYAVFLCQKNHFEKGEKMALEAAQNPLYKSPEIAWLNAANCARSSGDMQRAEKHLRAAVAARPKFAPALVQLAEVEFELKQYVPARAFLERYQEIGRATPSTLWLGFRIERNLGNDAGAKNYAQRLKSEFPNAAETKELLESDRAAR